MTAFTKDDEPIFYEKPAGIQYNVGDRLWIAMNYNNHMEGILKFWLKELNLSSKARDFDHILKIFEKEVWEVLECRVRGYAYNKGMEGKLDGVKYIVLVNKILFSNQDKRHVHQVNTLDSFHWHWVMMGDYLRKLPYAQKALGIKKAMREQFVFR